MSKEEIIFNTTNVNVIEETHYKTEMIIGNCTIYNTKHFNWFQKKMIKIFFGIVAKDIYNDKKGDK